MRLRLLVVNGLILGAVGWMATLGGVGVRAAELLPRKSSTPADFAKLESQAAVSHDARSIADLAGAYLDRGQPGLATAVIEQAPSEVRSRPEIAGLHARALFHRGRARQALAVAREAADSCAEGRSCPAWLLAKTARQVAFLEQVVAVGIDDPQDNPEAIRAAYERSAREVRLVAMR
jgi:hypothetical protein